MEKLCIFLLVSLLFLFAGCCQQIKMSGHQECKTATYTVLDDEGRKLTFSEKPQHIVSLTYGTDEILTDLVDSKRITAYSRWAEDSGISFITRDQMFKVGRKVNENLEAILALHPDLVIASSATNSDLITGLETAGLKVYIARSPKNYSEMQEKILNLAAAVGETEKGEALVKQMDEKLRNLEARMRKLPDDQRKVAVAFNFTSAMGRRGDLLDNMLEMAHVINGVATLPQNNNLEHGQLVVSKEMVVGINPDVFLLPTWNFDNRRDVQGYAQQIANDPAYRNIKAVKNGEIKFVPDKYRYVASHHFADAVEKVARTVYPEMF